MALVFDPAIEKAVADVRSDSTPTNWVSFKYEGKNKLVVGAKGSNGFAEFKASLAEDQCTWAFLRMIAGDQESKRAKFIFVQYNGSSLGGMAKSRSGVHKPDVERVIGQHHVFFFSDGPEDMAEEIIMEKVNKSAGRINSMVDGANYDLGSNAKGYDSKAGDIKAAAASTYKTKEKETGLTKPIVFCETALPKSTPCDLSGRPTVAAPTEARKNTDMKGKLDVSKWQTAK